MNYSILFDEFPILETQRLILKPLEVDSFQDLFSLYNDPDIVKRMSNGKIFNLQETYDTIINYYPNLFHEKKGLAWGLFLKQNNSLVGLRICFIDDFNGSVLIQGQILKKYRRQGLTIESYIEIIRLLRKAEIKEIKANCLNDNFEGIGLLKKLGFDETPLKLWPPFRPKTNVIWYQKDLTIENTKLFNENIDPVPKTFDEAYNLANERFLKKEFAFTEDYINIALAIEPNNLNALLLKGKTLFRLKNILSAMEYFKLAAEIDNKCTEAYREWGICQYNLKMWEDAHETWGIAFKLGDQKAKKLIDENVTPW